MMFNCSSRKFRSKDQVALTAAAHWLAALTSAVVVNIVFSGNTGCGNNRGFSREQASTLVVTYSNKILKLDV